MEDSKNRNYQVILINQLVNGQSLGDVINNLSKLFNKDKKSIEQILSQQGFVVKSNVDEEQAKKIQAEIRKAGLCSQIKKVDIADSNTFSPPHHVGLISCPKCGTQQKANESCSNCGIFFQQV